MATPVPYSGTETVSPQLNPLSPVHVDAPIAAFGGATAGAITHMGEVVEGAGKELFDRANAMQTLHQEDIANSALGDFQNQLVGKFEEYSKYQGQDAIAHNAEFNQSTEDLRQTFADQMPSPFARRTFNNESRQSRFRTVFAAGNYAREEMKKFTTQAFDQRMAGEGQGVAAVIGSNPDALDPAIERTKAVSGQKWQEKGFHPGTPEYDQAVAGDVSGHVVAPALRTLANTNPILARTLQQDQLTKGHLTEVDSANLDPTIERHLINQGARSAGISILSGEAGDWGAQPVTVSRGLDALSKTSGTGGYALVGKEDANGNGHPVGKYGVPSSELPRWLTDAGMPAMSEQEFLANPKAQDQLATDRLGAFQKQYGSFDEAMKVWSSGIDTDNRIKSAHKALVDSSSRSDLAATTERVATKLQPNDPMFVQATKDHVDTQVTKTAAFLQQDKIQNASIVTGGLLGDGAPNGKLPTTETELKAISPEVSDAVDKIKMDTKAQTNLHKALRNNIQEGYAITPENQALYERLRGAAMDPYATADDRQALVDSDPASLEMPIKQRKELAGLRKGVIAGATASPRMGEALSAAADVIAGYGISKQEDPDRYNQFLSQFHDAITGYGQGQEKPVRDADVYRQIAQQVLQRREPNSWWQRTVGVPPTVGESQVPEAAEDKAKFMDAYRQVYPNAPEPTDRMLNNFILQLQFQQVAATKKKQQSGKQAPGP